MVSASSFSAPGFPAGREMDWCSAGWNESPSSCSARAPRRQEEGLLLPSSSLGPPFDAFCLCPSCVFGRELLVASVTCCFGGRPSLGRPLLTLPVAIVCHLQPEPILIPIPLWNGNDPPSPCLLQLSDPLELMGIYTPTKMQDDSPLHWIGEGVEVEEGSHVARLCCSRFLLPEIARGGLPCWLSQGRICLQCGRCGFDP